MSERGLDPDSDDTDGLQKVLLDTERGSCDEYLACLFILVADGGRHQGLKRALDNQYLMNKDTYHETLPQALTLLEQLKPESFTDAATGEPAGDSGVAFAQTNSYLPTCIKCGTQGHTVNGCPKLDAAGRERFLSCLSVSPELFLSCFIKLRTVVNCVTLRTTLKTSWRIAV